MIALDTNLLVRFATQDSPHEAAIAQQLLGQSRVFVPITVLLETEWVLRSRYAYTRDLFVAFVRHLAGLPNVELQHNEAAHGALLLHESGLDFADALHYRLSQPALLHTLDKKLAAAAKRNGCAVELHQA